MDEPDRKPVIGESAQPGSYLGVASVGPGHGDHDPTRAASGGVDVGRVIEVTVDNAGEREVRVRLADGREGVIGRAEFDPAPSAGDRVRAALLAREDPRDRVWLSHAWARKLDGWAKVEGAMADNSAITGPVVKAVKGGFVVDLGVRGFLPTSHVPEELLSDLVGTDIRALVIELDRDKDRVVLSIRDLDRRESRDREKLMFKSLEVGTRVDGVVDSIAEYGAIIDLGGARGLLPRRELSWGRVDHVGDIVNPGDQVRVQVTEVNRSKRRIALSLRRTGPDPLAELSEGDVVMGTVTKVVEFGAFMRIGETELEGLAHVSELTELPSHDARELVIPGEQLPVRVVKIETRKRRIALSVIEAI